VNGGPNRIDAGRIGNCSRRWPNGIEDARGPHPRGTRCVRAVPSVAGLHLHVLTDANSGPFWESPLPDSNRPLPYHGSPLGHPSEHRQQTHLQSSPNGDQPSSAARRSDRHPAVPTGCPGASIMSRRSVGWRAGERRPQVTRRPGRSVEGSRLRAQTIRQRPPDRPCSSPRHGSRRCSGDPSQAPARGSSQPGPPGAVRSRASTVKPMSRRFLAHPFVLATGIALHLTGLGFLVLTLRVLHRPSAVKEARRLTDMAVRPAEAAAHRRN
jgi:hypothetical protein